MIPQRAALRPPSTTLLTAGAGWRRDHYDRLAFSALATQMLPRHHSHNCLLGASMPGSLGFLCLATAATAARHAATARSHHRRLGICACGKPETQGRSESREQSIIADSAWRRRIISDSAWYNVSSLTVHGTKDLL